jgi:hypothetical protein
VHINSASGSEQELLQSADVHVVLLSQSYAKSPREMDELSVLLSQTRSRKDYRLLYVIKVNELPQKPTYIHLVPCDTALNDHLWVDLAEKHLVQKEFRLSQSYAEDREMKIPKAELLPLAKAFADIAWKLDHQR